MMEQPAYHAGQVVLIRSYAFNYQEQVAIIRGDGQQRYASDVDRMVFTYLGEVWVPRLNMYAEGLLYEHEIVRAIER